MNEAGITEENLWIKYSFSLYYICVTICTVGYGGNILMKKFIYKFYSDKFIAKNIDILRIYKINNK